MGIWNFIIIVIAWLFCILHPAIDHPLFQLFCAALITYWQCGEIASATFDDDDEDDCTCSCDLCESTTSSLFEPEFNISFDESSIGPEFPTENLNEGHIHFLEGAAVAPSSDPSVDGEPLVLVYQYNASTKEWALVADVPYFTKPAK